jgi:hypothetical protein
VNRVSAAVTLHCTGAPASGPPAKYLALTVTSPAPPTRNGPWLACAETSNSGRRNSSTWIVCAWLAAIRPWVSKMISALPRFGVLGSVNRVSNPPVGLTGAAPFAIWLPVSSITLYETAVTAPASPPTSPFLP